jgi:hypothetical protein
VFFCNVPTTVATATQAARVTANLYFLGRMPCIRGMGVRETSLFTDTFPDNLRFAPNVIAMVDGYDTAHNDNRRIMASMSDATVSGFALCARLWDSNVEFDVRHAVSRPAPDLDAASIGGHCTTGGPLSSFAVLHPSSFNFENNRSFQSIGVSAQSELLKVV